MSRGRKPDAKAQRRSRDKAQLVPATVVDAPAALAMPPSVAAVPALAEAWGSLVGSGMAYDERDSALLEQLVFDLETARQAREMCIDENGRIAMMVGKGEPDPETGRYLDQKPNPYLKVMREATAEALKLADQLGLTPLARARLGLTQAAGAAVTRSIVDQIDAVLSRGSKR